MQSSFESTDLILLFVYGTLKKGFPNAHVMPITTTYLETATTVSKWPLVVDPVMSIPFLLYFPDSNQAKFVTGELYKADSQALEFLDSFEGISSGFYKRMSIEVISVIDQNTSNDEKPDTQKLSAFAYFRDYGGPEWCKQWTPEKLATLPMLDSYTLEYSKSYVRPQLR